MQKGEKKSTDMLFIGILEVPDLFSACVCDGDQHPIWVRFEVHQPSRSGTQDG